MKIYRSLKKRGQQCLSVLMVFSILVGIPAVSGIGKKRMGIDRAYAATATEKREEAIKKLDKITAEINDMTGVQTELDRKLKTTTQKLTQLMAEQQILKDEMDYLQTQIDQANQDLAEAKRVEAEQYEAMKLRIKFMYENSTDSSVWQTLVEASGITDLLNRVEYVNQVYRSDRNLMDAYQATISEIEALTAQLNREMEDMQVLKASYDEQQLALEATTAELKSMSADYASRIAKAQTLAKNYAQVIAEQNEIIRKEEEERKRKEEEERRRREEEERRRKEEEERKKKEEGAAASTGGSESKDPTPVTNVKGTDVVAYARQFVGNPYVWGGNSLTKGCDCSGFINLVYAHFGITVPRYSMSFVTTGKAVTMDKIQPGDIIVYEPKNGIGHVAIYAGNGKIVEAQSTAAGITDNRSAEHNRKILAIRRIL